jgi:hypothetical protein
MSPTRAGSLLKEIRRQSRVFVDDEFDDGETLAGFGDAGKRYDAEDEQVPGAEEYVADGDDEDEGEQVGEVQSVLI